MLIRVPADHKGIFFSQMAVSKRYLDEALTAIMRRTMTCNSSNVFFDFTRSSPLLRTTLTSVQIPFHCPSASCELFQAPTAADLAKAIRSCPRLRSLRFKLCVASTANSFEVGLLTGLNALTKVMSGFRNLRSCEVQLGFNHSRPKERGEISASTLEQVAEVAASTPRQACQSSIDRPGAEEQ